MAHLRGELSETITYVFQRAGKYVFPEVKINWWDLREKRLREIRLPEVTVDVSPAPEVKGGDLAGGVKTSTGWWKAVAGGLFVLLLAGGIIYRFREPNSKTGDGLEVRSSGK